MIVAGFGMNGRATDASLRAALEAALAGGPPPDALAALGDHAPRLAPLAAALALPLIRVPCVAGIATPTQSPRSLAAHGAGSVAEAVALAAAGPGAALTGHRAAARDGTATCAIARGPGDTERNPA